jgi:hypothetical protein
MIDVLDEIHAKNLKTLIRYHGRDITIIDPDGNEFIRRALWNSVEHVLKLDITSGDPMGARNSIYIDRDSLQTETGEIKPGKDWHVFGSPNSYDEEKTYTIEIPKQDYQLPGIVLFLSEKRDGATSWEIPT